MNFGRAFPLRGPLPFSGAKVSRNSSVSTTSAKTFQGTGVLEEHLSDALRFT